MKEVQQQRAGNMSSVFHDQSLLDAFKRAGSNKPARSPDVLKVNVLDWGLEANGMLWSPGMCTMTKLQLTG
jgi:hypothetical protein